MVVHRKIQRKCRACGKRVQLFEYVGLLGGWYGSHLCPQSRTWYLKHQDVPLFRNLPEAK